MPEAPRIVISNTTPIIALSILERLDLLHQLYGEIWIPPAVRAELRRGGTRAGAQEVQTAAFIRTVPLLSPSQAELLIDLDPGEAEVLALALERKADLVILDERLGRGYARRLGLALTGVLGVLLRAQQEGYLDALEPEIMRLKQAGIRLGDDLVARVLQMSGERE